MAEVTIYEYSNFKGQSRTLGVGNHRFFNLDDFNDRANSIRVPAGLVAWVYEHADGGGGYGISADFLEDCADLSQFKLNETISFIAVFQARSAEGYIWRRMALVDGQFVPGHWERPRAGGQPPDPPVVVVSPPIPPHDFVQPVITTGGTIAEPDSNQLKNHPIHAFAPPGRGEEVRWEHAVSSQMGIIASDFRGVEELGSACFQRASNNPVIPDWLNFWFPQKQGRDHRAIVYYKRTLSGTLRRSAIYHNPDTFPDFDLNIDIEPAKGYEYLITDGHPREYTDLMSKQWDLSAHQSGQPDCDDAKSIESFNFVEAEVDTHPDIKERLNAQLQGRVGSAVCVYGPWIYDAGHCCHPEIHPAEQIWWSDPTPQGRVYFCHLLVDESRRFWWRDQMDNGTKLKPWGAPPITGTFAIAFEATMNAPAIQYGIRVLDTWNNETAHEDFIRHHLVYGNNTLVSVVQDPVSLVKVSFENVGLVGGNTVRGFVVLEATVGKVIPSGDVPPGTDVNTVDQLIERLLFTKETGRLVMEITQAPYSLP